MVSQRRSESSERLGLLHPMSPNADPVHMTILLATLSAGALEPDCSFEAYEGN